MAVTVEQVRGLLGALDTAILVVEDGQHTRLQEGNRQGYNNACRMLAYWRELSLAVLKELPVENTAEVFPL